MQLASWRTSNETAAPPLVVERHVSPARANPHWFNSFSILPFDVVAKRYPEDAFVSARTISFEKPRPRKAEDTATYPSSRTSEGSSNPLFRERRSTYLGHSDFIAQTPIILVAILVKTTNSANCRESLSRSSRTAPPALTSPTNASISPRLNSAGLHIRILGWSAC
jgi:hypothetical protein